MSDCGMGSPVQHLARCGLLNRRLLAVHVNYLARKDAALLGARRVSVVHCPRSHHYFQHEPFALRRLARARVNICLGTDSLATVYQKRNQPVELNMFEEMRALAHAAPLLSARKLLGVATVNGARALGLGGRIGELSRHASADLIAIPFAGPATQAHDAVLHHRGDVALSIIAGKWTGVGSPPK
jgi:cytosine/adenosine deaminase-related metal-dependent hydrolase